MFIIEVTSPPDPSGQLSQGLLNLGQLNCSQLSQGQPNYSQLSQGQYSQGELTTALPRLEHHAIVLEISSFLKSKKIFI